MSIANDTDSAHNIAECSGNGRCNYKTGECSCAAPFTGNDCGRFKWYLFNISLYYFSHSFAYLPIYVVMIIVIIVVNVLVYVQLLKRMMVIDLIELLSTSHSLIILFVYSFTHLLV